jgi:hypothetical protein
MPQLPQNRNYFRLQIPLPKRILALQRGNRMHGMGAPDVGKTGLGKPEKSYLALSDQITDRASHVLDRHSSIDAVLIKQIDELGTKPAQATLYRLTDMLGPAVHVERPALQGLLEDIRNGLVDVSYSLSASR